MPGGTPSRGRGAGWRWSLVVCVTGWVACADSPAPVDALDEPPPVAPVPAADEPAATPPVAPPVDTEGPALEAPPELGRGAPQRIGARHILVTFDGCVGANPNLRRSRAEAIERAQGVLDAIERGEDFADLARRFSEDSSKNRGGDVGGFGRGVMQAEFERAAFALKVGEHSGLVETPFGIHIIERTPLVEVRLAHVLVQWEGVRRAASSRTKEEAKAQAEAARERLVAGEAVADVAAALSDGASGVRGGDLGWFQKGQMMPQFESFVYTLKVGEASPVVETEFGYHVVVRVE